MRFTKDMASSVHQQVQHQTPVVAYCGACGTRYYVALSTWQQLKGMCDCSWSCCATARPGNKDHARHILSRQATGQDILDAEAGLIKDLRK